MEGFKKGFCIGLLAAVLLIGAGYMFNMPARGTFDLAVGVFIGNIICHGWLLPNFAKLVDRFSKPATPK